MGLASSSINVVADSIVSNARSNRSPVDVAGVAGDGKFASRARKPLIARVANWTALSGTLALLGYVLVLEAGHSYLQSLFVSRAVEDMRFAAEAGPSSAIVFPESGPYDQRFGYVGLPSFIRKLSARSFVIDRQARQSTALREFMTAGGYAVYHEKSQAGLFLRDRFEAPLEAREYPAVAYRNFAEIPSTVVDTLRFIEDRDLLDPTRPYRNPAVEWRRFLLAAAGRLSAVFDHNLRRGGASTLATQIEKFRHSPAGRTEGAAEKLRQMATATARAYLGGPETIAAQQDIVTTYLDATPLGSRPGYGEVIGLGDGLRVWYGTDFSEANRLLSLRALSSVEAARAARVYKHVLSLLIAQRRPSFYLNAGRDELERLTDAHLRVLAAAGIIGRSLCDQALKLPLEFASDPPAAPATSFIERKAVDAVRSELMAALGLSNLYALDRLDLSADVSIDGATQSRVAAFLERLKDPQAVKALGLVGDRLLGNADPGKVAWSVVLYERSSDRNLVRMRADSLDQPFDINSGAKLILGSTAKLRTLATYLDIVESLHRELSSASARTLQQITSTTADPLRRWAAQYLAALAPANRGLEPMLDAAMQRRYSANPGEAFFTGGGIHIFHNFERSEDNETPTVEHAFEHSINLAFVRLLRDVIRHYEAESGADTEVLQDPDSPAREDYLRRFADQEGRVYINRFYSDYASLSPDEALERFAGHVRPAPRKLAIVFRSVRPNASLAELRDFLARRLPGVSLDETAVALYTNYAPEKFSLNDRGYLAGANPLELWLVAYLQHHPDVTRSGVIAASAEQRQEAYGWLFKTRNIHKQDVRIRMLIEEDAFNRLLEDWKRQGYPFGHVIPSLATAIGSSGDRPDALATLMGIILNDGLRQPTTDIERLHFAAETPFDTDMVYRAAAPERVMSPAVAATLRRALAGVVEKGTGTRLRGVYAGSDGMPLAIGGKTGTGDNRFETFGSGHRLIEARAVDRTATFVFFLGDRMYGTVTAYVPGQDADRYHFTSALAVSLLKALEPELRPLLQSPGIGTRVVETPGSRG
jgi:membrane peptidoglycan carboxypeptidase